MGVIQLIQKKEEKSIRSIGDPLASIDGPAFSMEKNPDLFYLL